MRYQVIARKRHLKVGDKPYVVFCEFDKVTQIYYMMDKVDRVEYSDVLVIDTQTNEILTSREFELYEPMVKRRKK